jgi:prephenate dehydrogenase
VSSDQPPFSRIAVVGLGLIGGSVALAARAAWPSVSIAGFDDSAGIRAAAHGRVVDRVADRLEDLDGCDLVVLAVPLSAMAGVLPAVARFNHSSVVTDVGSTKRNVMQAARDEGLGRFVGGHPMAGSERGGLDEARRDLFAGRPWLLVSPDRLAAEARAVERFVAGLGAVPHWIDAETHDRTVAYLSHLLQLVSVAIMNTAASALEDRELATAGRAFDEMTRLASSPPGMWQEILADNAPFVREALTRFVAELPAAADVGDRRWIAEAFDRAARARSRVGSPRTTGAG